MRIIVTKDYEEMSLKAAEIMRAQIQLKPNSVIGLATGSTPLGLYSNLAKWNEEGSLDFKEVITVNLDEYKGLPAEHDQSYIYFMNKNLFSKINIDKNNTHLPNGMAEDADKECARYDALIKSLGGQDMQLLGIGHNGHIGFNEPADAFANGTYCVKLTESTINANSRFFASADDVPKYAFSMGCGVIMNAKRILMVATGEEKAQAIHDMVKGPISPKCPASILQMHPDVVVVVDEGAAKML